MPSKPLSQTVQVKSRPTPAFYWACIWDDGSGLVFSRKGAAEDAVKHGRCGKRLVKLAEVTN